MKRRVKEFVDIEDHVSLDALIEKLAEIRDSLPDSSEAELRLRGDEVFGHRITIAFLREQTDEEAAVESATPRHPERRRSASSSGSRPSSGSSATPRRGNAGSCASSRNRFQAGLKFSASPFMQ